MSDSPLTTSGFLLDRLERLEERMKAMGTASGGGQSSFVEMETEVRRQKRIIAALQAQMFETQQRVAAESRIIEQRLGGVSKEASLVPQPAGGQDLSDLRESLQTEVQESIETALTTFEQNLEHRISLRISKLEKALIDQAAVVSALGQRVIDSDANLQRLISAVERLCERNDTRYDARNDTRTVKTMPTAPSPAPRNPAPHNKEAQIADLPFERHLTAAIKRQPVPNADPVFKPRIVKEETGKLRPRTPLTRNF
jgi:hypothetical protein